MDFFLKKSLGNPESVNSKKTIKSLLLIPSTEERIESHNYSLEKWRLRENAILEEWQGALLKHRCFCAFTYFFSFKTKERL